MARIEEISGYLDYKMKQGVDIKIDTESERMQMQLQLDTKGSPNRIWLAQISRKNMKAFT